MLDDFRFRLRTLFRRNVAEDDLDDELRFHLERAAEQHEARGLSAREARRRARVEFGQVDVVKDDCRQSWGVRQLDALHQDVAYALRLIRKHPALSAVAAVSLAIGIGLNTALFALLDATILRRLPVARPGQLVDVYTSNVDGFAWYGSSYPDYLDLRSGTRTLAGLVGYVPAVGAVGFGDRARALAGEAVTGNYFQLLGVPAAHGRTLLPDDDRPGATPVVVISSGLWSDLFAEDPEVMGRSLRIGGRPYAVVGVAPEGFGGLTPPVLRPAFWMPMTWVDDVQPTVMHNGSPTPGATRLESRGLRWLLVKGRLRAGETAASANADLNGMMQALEAAHPDSNEGLRATVIPTGDVSTHPLVEERLRAGALSLLVLLGLVLLIACANVAGAPAGAGIGATAGNRPASRGRGEPRASAAATARGEHGAGAARRGRRHRTGLGVSRGTRRRPRIASGAGCARSVADRPGARPVGRRSDGGRNRGGPDAGVGRHAVQRAGRAGRTHSRLVDRRSAVEPAPGARCTPARRLRGAARRGRSARTQSAGGQPDRYRLSCQRDRLGHGRPRPGRIW